MQYLVETIAGNRVINMPPVNTIPATLLFQKIGVTISTKSDLHKLFTRTLSCISVDIQFSKENWKVEIGLCQFFI